MQGNIDLNAGYIQQYVQQYPKTARKNTKMHGTM